MEECDLLRERFHAITTKHRIQQDIHQKKLQLDQEKVQLQHLRKKTLKERWLLQDSQQQELGWDYSQTRALQLTIHKIEKEVECLEKQESMIAANECFILNKLKALEEGPHDVIKEANKSFVSESFQITEVLPGDPDVSSLPIDKHDQPNAQVSHKQRSEHSAHEVEHSPAGNTVYCQIKQQNPNKRKERGFANHHNESQHQGGLHRENVLSSSGAEADFSCKGQGRRRPHDELCSCRVVKHKGCGHHHGNRRDYSYSRHSNGMSRRSSVRSHDQEETTRQPSETYLPADLYEYAGHSPSSILSSLQGTEPITAIFMGFHMAQDDSEQLQEFEGTLKAELIIIQDNEDHSEAISVREMKDHPQGQIEHSGSRNMGVHEGDGCMERRLGRRMVKKRHKPCCSIC